MSFMDGLRGPSPLMTMGLLWSSHNILRGPGGYQIRQELAIQTPGYPLNSSGLYVIVKICSVMSVYKPFIDKTC